MEFGWINKTYRVNACIGRRIEMRGDLGTIVKDMGNYVGVNFDKDEPIVVLPCHPTWKMKYLEMGKPRKYNKKKQKAKDRYQKYLEFSDCHDSFIDFCRYEDYNNKFGEI